MLQASQTPPHRATSQPSVEMDKGGFAGKNATPKNKTVGCLDATCIKL